MKWKEEQDLRLVRPGPVEKQERSGERAEVGQRPEARRPLRRGPESGLRAPVAPSAAAGARVVAEGRSPGQRRWPRAEKRARAAAVVAAAEDEE